MKKIFCVTGKTGSGKSTFTKRLINLLRRDKDIDIKPLVYCTTRKPRQNELDGIDYYFTSVNDFANTKFNDIVEARKYFAINGPVFYYTTLECLSPSDNFICAASIEQLVNYIRSANVEVFNIDIECSTLNRVSRILKDRCKTDDDVYELCRRVLQEREDYDKQDVKDVVSLIPSDHKIALDNNSIEKTVLEATIEIGSRWIKDCIKKEAANI